MSLGNWLRGREATVEELREQLSGAEMAHAEALEAVATAQAAFDEAGSDASAKALVKAREAAGLADEHVERAKRLLAAGEAKAAEAERQRLMARRAELEGLISVPAVREVAAPFVAEELALLEEVAKFRARRVARGEELRRLEVELITTRRTLGEKVDDWAFNHATNPLASHTPIETAIEERARQLEEPLRSLLRELAPRSTSSSIPIPPVQR